MFLSEPFLPMTRKILSACHLVIGLSLIASQAGAQTVLWSGGAGTNAWGSGANWSPVGVPNNTSNVTFDNSIVALLPATVALGANRNANSLVFNTGNAFSLINGGGNRTLNLASGSITRSTTSSGAQSLAFSTLALGANGNFSIDGGGTFTISSAISDGGNGYSVTKNGSGLIILSGINTFGGDVNINAGTLSVGTDANLGNTGVNNTIALNGGTLQATSSFAVNGNRAVNVGAGGGTFDVSSGQTLTLGTAGQLTGTGTLTKTSAGTLALGASNTGFAGNMNLNGGVTRLSAYDAAGTNTGSTVTLNNGAELEAAFGSNTNFQPNIVINNGIIRHTDASGVKAGFQNNTGTVTSLTINGAAQLIDQDGGPASGFVSFDGVVKLNTGANVTANAVNATDEVRFGGAQNITMSAGTTLTTTGAGKVTFGNASARTIIGQGTSTQQATLILGAASNIANAGTSFQINGSGTGGISVQGVQAKVDSLMTDARLAATTGSGGTLTIAYTDAGSRTLSSAANLAAASAVALGLQSNGGTFTLGTAGGGTNELNHWGGLLVGPNTTATFADNNVFNSGASLTLLGGTLKLSNTNQTFGTLDVTANSVIDFSGAAGIFNINNLIIGVGVTLSVINWQNVIDKFFVANWAGATFDTTGSSPMNQVVFSGYSGNSTKWQGYDQQVTPVPEPTAYGVLLLASAIGIYLRRRKSAAG